MYNINIGLDTDIEKLKLILNELDRREKENNESLLEPGKCCELCGREYELEKDKYEAVATKTGRLFTVCDVCAGKIKNSLIEMK